VDIEAIRRGAQKFEGAHDLRNFFKIDPGKVITNFERRISECDIFEVARSRRRYPPALGLLRAPGVPRCTTSTSNVKGSAFLWHRTRCMVAVIFIVGQSLEAPDKASFDQCLLELLLDGGEVGAGLELEPAVVLAHIGEFEGHEPGGVLGGLIILSVCRFRCFRERHLWQAGVVAQEAPVTSADGWPLSFSSSWIRALPAPPLSIPHTVAAFWALAA
jgi:hypothetical protein